MPALREVILSAFIAGFCGMASHLLGGDVWPAMAGAFLVSVWFAAKRSRRSI